MICMLKIFQGFFLDKWQVYQSTVDFFIDTGGEKKKARVWVFLCDDSTDFCSVTAGMFVKADIGIFVIKANRKRKKRKNVKQK